MKTLSQKGFSLIEMMVALGIFSFVMLAFMSALQNALIINQTADTKNNLSSIVASTAGQAFNQATCTAAVTKVAQTYDGHTLQFDTLKAGANLQAYNLTVKSLTYLNSTLAQTSADGIKVYYGTITLTATANRLVYGGQTFAPRPIAAVYVIVGPDGIITGCGPMAPVFAAPPPPPGPALPAETKTFDFDADPRVCENFPIKARCDAGQKIVVTNSSYGANCGGVPADYGQGTVESLCNGQQNCDFTAGNNNNCTTQGVFVDPAVGCPKSFHMEYHCQ